LGTFRIKIVVEPPTEFTGFNPHDIVICGVIPKAAPKNVQADLLLADFGNPASKSSPANIQKKFTETS
jgi:hypothetical protein